MILRRITANFRRQDWTAVVVELVVVVVGVFISLQASNWNQDRISNQQSVIFAEVGTNQDNLMLYYPEIRSGLRALAREKP